jgi:hypothetical protein
VLCRAGEITVTLYVDAGVPTGGDNGRLWGIDPPPGKDEGTNPAKVHGDRTAFEMRPL